MGFTYLLLLTTIQYTVLILTTTYCILSLPPTNRKIKDNQRAPIFMQFIECVWQLLQQFPVSFEYDFIFIFFLSPLSYPFIKQINQINHINHSCPLCLSCLCLYCCLCLCLYLCLSVFLSNISPPKHTHPFLIPSNLHTTLTLTPHLTPSSKTVIDGTSDFCW